MGQFCCRVFVGLVALMVVPFAFGQSDIEKSKDYPGISRMPGYLHCRIQGDGFRFLFLHGHGRRQAEGTAGRRAPVRSQIQP